MTLKQFIKRHGGVQLAKDLGISQSYLSQLASGHRKLSLDSKSGRRMINLILQYTEGKVRLKDLRPDEYAFVLREVNRLKKDIENI